MIIRESRRVYRNQIERVVGKNCSSSDVLDYIFESEDCHIVVKEYKKSKNTVLNRLNMLWAAPFTLILYPFMYVKNGYVGWDANTRTGRFILRAIGELD